MGINLGFGELKTPEIVYYDIITYVLQNRNTIEDNDEIVLVHPVHYYTTGNYTNSTVKPYVYTGDIELCSNVRLHFYFSWKRSYIGIYKFDEDADSTDFAKLQYLLMIYCDKMLLKYHLQDFIYNLV
jgi:hypothetical protein